MKRGAGISIITIIIIVVIVSLIVNFYIFSDRNSVYFNKRNWKTTITDEVGGDEECTA